MTTLDEIRERAGRATEGPWMAQEFDTNPGDEGSCIVAGEGMESRAIAYSIPYPWHPEKATVADAEFIAHAREDVPTLVKALRAVEAVHEPILALDYGVRDAPLKRQVCTGCGQDDGNWQIWPCPTIRAIEDALQ